MADHPMCGVKRSRDDEEMEDWSDEEDVMQDVPVVQNNEKKNLIIQENIRRVAEWRKDMYQFDLSEVKLLK